MTSGSEWIIAYEPATGKELWRTTGVWSNAIHTPLVGDGLVIVTAGYPERRVIAIRPGGTGNISGTDRIAWTYDKGTAYVVSPILYKGVVYLVNDRGVITALDAKRGKVIYEGGRIPKPATFMGSPVAFGDQILLTSEDGETFFMRAGATHEILRSNSVDEPVYSSLALANGRIYIRGERHLFAIGPPSMAEIGARRYARAPLATVRFARGPATLVGRPTGGGRALHDGRLRRRGRASGARGRCFAPRPATPEGRAFSADGSLRRRPALPEGGFRP